ncbi:MAG: molybdenum cofactor biosynthesis protein MoaE [Actinobacteria bacterium]|nr:molybdenum cofactor biosynthesis protein MoaE [Actinomycetota bacterium]
MAPDDTDRSGARGRAPPVHRRHLPYDGPVSERAPSQIDQELPGDIDAALVSDGDDWTGLTGRDLPVAEVSSWVARPDCGAVVVFTGTARDHSEGRPGVEQLTYEAYAGEVVPRLDAVVAELRRRWTVGRVAILHRVGEVRIGSAAVVVAVSAAHRDEAFAAARFGIDAVKATAPIWKSERWRDGEDWGLGGSDVVEAAQVATSVRTASSPLAVGQDVSA